MSFGSSISTGSTTSGMPAIGVPVRKPDPTIEYLASGPGALTPQIPQQLDSHFDDVTRNFGFRTYEAMLTDPAVSSSFMALKLSILNGPIQVTPAVTPKGYRYRPPGERPSKPAKGTSKPPTKGDTPSKNSGSSSPTPSPSRTSDASGASPSRPSPSSSGKPSDNALSPDESLAQEVAEFCERELCRLRTPFKSTLLQMLDAMAFGSKLAEKTREVCESGPDAGKLVLKSIKVKPEFAWKYVVNTFLDIVGILTYIPPGMKGVTTSQMAQGGLVILPVEKFAHFAWLPKDGDPRGTSALRAAYDWWNLKQQCKPFYYAHLRRFGSPSLDGVLAPDDTAPSAAINPLNNAEIPGQTVTPAQRFVDHLIAFQNNSVIVRPAGSELNIVEPTSNGEAFLNGFDLFDRQICLAIGLQARASLEAKHGSKADSDTAENTRGLVIAYGREALGSWITKEVLHDSVTLNYGKDVADRFTPPVQVGESEAQDWAANLTAASGAGYTIGESQLPELDGKLNMPDRDIEADKASADEAAEKAAALAPKPMGGVGGKPGDKGSKPASKPAAKSTSKGAK